MIHDPQISLLLLQSSCFSITLVLAVLLLLSRWLQPRSVGLSYETSRWLLIAAMLVFAVHYLLQMIYGFRAQGDDVGALVNILFYLPASFLIDCAIVRISTGQRYMKRFVTVGVTFVVVELALFALGWALYGSLHMGMVLNVMGTVFVAQIIFFIFYPGREVRRMANRLEEETAADITDFRLHMRSGTLLLYTMGLIGALSIYRTSFVAAVAIFFLMSLIIYVACFVALGFNIAAVSSVVDEAKTPADVPAADSATADDAATQTHLTPELKGQIEAALATWRAEHGYSLQNLTCSTMAQRLNVSKRNLTQYLAETEGLTFRVWLSNIRIDEAKRMLMTDTQCSIETIAEACGFSSRSWMQEKFKNSTGMTPTEWREARGEG